MTSKFSVTWRDVLCDFLASLAFALLGLAALVDAGWL